MHPALQIEEILYNIFGHYHSTPDLAALARTCRTFTDPALDMLWETTNMTQIARCLPDVARKTNDSLESELYEFHRPLTDGEWDVLRSYTRRIRFIHSLHGLNRKSLQCLYNPPTPEPIFSSLRRLHLEYTPRAFGLLNMHFPSLTALSVMVYTPRLFEDSLRSFAKTSPKLHRLLIDLVLPSGIDMSRMDASFIRQWGNLKSVHCSGISLDALTVMHLSRMPALTGLSFTVSSALLGQISPADTPISFPNMAEFNLRSESLDSMSRLLSQARFPVVTNFYACIERCPSRLQLSSFLAEMSGTRHTIRKLSLYHVSDSGHTHVSKDRDVLGAQHLQLCTAFTSLRSITLDIEWKVDLKDSELLEMASAWPHLEYLRINPRWGWNTPGGISPNGLISLLQTCPSLRGIALVMDTRGDIEIPSSPSIRLAEDAQFDMNVLDSFIEEASVPIVAAFIAAILPPCDFSMRAWLDMDMVSVLHRNAYKKRWDNVRKGVKDIVLQRSLT